MSSYASRALPILCGVLADRYIPDPKRHHPVALFGCYAQGLERRLYRDTRTAGLLYTAAATIPPVALAAFCSARAPRLTLTLALWAALGGTTLERVGEHMADALEARDIATARTLIPWLCSRDPQLLDLEGCARAATESLAENTCDAATAPLFWALCAGAPGVVAHRCINTLDAMVGYHNERYEHFGYVPARLDDIAAWIPARLTALIHVAYTALTTRRKGRVLSVLRAWREDAPLHPSPNAGPVEATAAAALGVRLGGRTVYAHGVEERPTLGEGDAPTLSTVRDAVRLTQTTQTAQLVCVLALCGLRALWGRRKAR